VGGGVVTRRGRFSPGGHDQLLSLSESNTYSVSGEDESGDDRLRKGLSEQSGEFSADRRRKRLIVKSGWAFTLREHTIKST